MMAGFTTSGGGLEFRAVERVDRFVLDEVISSISLLSHSRFLADFSYAREVAALLHNANTYFRKVPAFRSMGVETSGDYVEKLHEGNFKAVMFYNDLVNVLGLK